VFIENGQDPGMTAYGFQIHKELHPGPFTDAGLRLQEHLSAQMRRSSVETSSTPKISLQWYELENGDQFLSPEVDDERFGVQLDGTLENVVYRMCSTGWQLSPIPSPIPNTTWYPEIYTFGPGTEFRNFTALHRWIGGDVGELGGNEQASKYPALPTVVNWHRAAHIPVADLAAVPAWADYSGRGRSLRQLTGGKQPVVRRDSPTGFRYVRFDGSNDSLAGSFALLEQPLTVFMVMRATSGGGTQQVWLGSNQAGPSLLYRGDATNQVNVWAGGTDLTYNRGGNWPSPWMIWSVVLDGSDTTVWENLTPVGSGDPGSTGLAGLIMGNNVGETLPARLDVAELVISAAAVGDSARQDAINALNEIYQVF
jgi:hypothetical protein